MAYSKKNAKTPNSERNRRPFLSAEEVVQGIVAGGQEAIRCEAAPPEAISGSVLRNITITSTASKLTDLPSASSFTWNPAMTSIDVIVENATVRVDPTGGTPTASLGIPIYPGRPVRFTRAEALNGKWILATATTANVQVLENL